MTGTQRGLQITLSTPAEPGVRKPTLIPVPHASRHPHELSSRFYRPELDVVRFLAFLFVFLTHSLPAKSDISNERLTHGLQHILLGCQRISVYGLSLFFTLSAYLICELLIRERDANGTILVKRFYIRRILRIWPLYFAGLAIGMVIALVLGGRQVTFAWTAWAVVLLGNWFVIFQGLPGNVMFPLWSISVEEQFYLFAPWIVKALNRKALSVFSIAIIAFANFQLFFLGHIHAPDHVIWYNSFVQFENFSAGILLCLLLRGLSPNKSAWRRVSLLVVWAFCWYVSSYVLDIHTGSELAPGCWSLIGGYFLVALGCCFLLAAFLDLDKRFLPRWAIYLGRISYGLYVFHMLALHIIDRIVPHGHLSGFAEIPLRLGSAMGLTILIASLSYRYFETPFLQIKKRYEIIGSRPV